MRLASALPLLCHISRNHSLCLGVITLRLPGELAARAVAACPPSGVGAHVLAVGKLTPHAASGGRCVRVLRLASLSDEPQREALWSLEVAELWRAALPREGPTGGIRASTTPPSA